MSGPPTKRSARVAPGAVVETEQQRLPKNTPRRSVTNLFLDAGVYANDGDLEAARLCAMVGLFLMREAA